MKKECEGRGQTFDEDHVEDGDDVDVGESLEELDLSDGRYRYSVVLRMDQDPLESDHPARLRTCRLVNLTAKGEQSERVDLNVSLSLKTRLSSSRFSFKES
jgi:hypothetical protein